MFDTILANNRLDDYFTPNVIQKFDNYATYMTINTYRLTPQIPQEINQIQILPKTWGRWVVQHLDSIGQYEIISDLFSGISAASMTFTLMGSFKQMNASPMTNALLSGAIIASMALIIEDAAPMVTPLLASVTAGYGILAIKSEDSAENVVTVLSTLLTIYTLIAIWEKRNEVAHRSNPTPLKTAAADILLATIMTGLAITLLELGVREDINTCTSTIGSTMLLGLAILSRAEIPWTTWMIGLAGSAAISLTNNERNRFIIAIALTGIMSSLINGIWKRL
ncbi:MAG: hypothetical protein WCG42_05560 [Parachlamydiaceae bacterium]